MHAEALQDRKREGENGNQREDGRVHEAGGVQREPAVDDVAHHRIEDARQLEACRLPARKRCEIGAPERTNDERGKWLDTGHVRQRFLGRVTIAHGPGPAQ
jgi:hypothetical protein